MKTMTKLLLAALLLAANGYAFAQTNATATVSTSNLTDMHLSGFNGLKIEGPFDVIITQGSNESVKLDAPSGIMDRIVTEIDGGVLNIRNKHDNWGWGVKSWWSDKGIWHNHKKITVYITAKELSSITVSGSGSVTFNDGVIANSLKLKTRGSAIMKGKIQVTTLASSISGSGRMELSGTAETSTIQISGSGDFAARDLVTTNSAIRVSGSGHAEVNASDKVDAVAHGSAAISYTGAAKSVTSKKSGSGEIRRI